ncbi:EcsC family protein [Streptococcus uberis]|uniref:EcsC family protein n=1 Tax=Streptococcus uberis TaxID=1349 RepID=UPI003D77F639
MDNNILDYKELERLNELTLRYEKLIKPSTISKLNSKVKNKIPENIITNMSKLGGQISENELYNEILEKILYGYNDLEKQVAKFTISEKQIIAKYKKYNIASLNEIATLRSYEVSKIVSINHNINLILSLLEGAGTGFYGFWALAINIPLSNLLYFRAVQSIAMYYGYDVKNNPSELVIAGSVFTNALSPSNSGSNNELSTTIAKIVMISKADMTKAASKKSWEFMARKGGIPLLLTKLRATANVAAKKGLEKAGKKGLENKLFQETFELIGKKLSKEAISKSIPGISAGLSALIDVGQMAKVLEYAEIFYEKRFISEKEQRIIELKKVRDADISEAEYYEKV